ncbi:MAG: polysaccharide biosynthesis protein [Hungatella sp.]
MTDFFKKHTLITGALLLTMTGFFTRFLGFFYRIFLSRTIGAEGLGLYNMVHPIYGICFALCAGSMQTAISRFVAADASKSKVIFRIGLSISLSIALLLSLLIYQGSDFIARYILLEDRCTSLLPFMAISVPFSAVHACISGYYYGIRKTKIPALSQVIEQVIRMGAVFFIADILIKSGQEITVQLAAFGHLIGEAASCFYAVLAFSLFTPAPICPSPSGFFSDFRKTAAPLMTLALPLMGNRLILNVLASAEAIWIPNRLLAFGMTGSEAFRIYGVLTGMALPFILFPSTITNSMAVLLLPTVSQAQADGNRKRISDTIAMSIRYSLYMGILCIGIFTLFGKQLGFSVFHNQNAGSFIRILAWLCPFLYLSTTTGSILNGLGQTSTTFSQNALALILRLVFVVFGIPKLGITAYLWGTLISEILLASLHLYALKERIPFVWNVRAMILKPSFFLILSVGISYATWNVVSLPEVLPEFLQVSLQIALISFCYGGLLLLFHQKSVRTS